ncbi:MAG TPA: hypothetical protein VKZ53_07560 [Candidatus Angelobacter sp.]|nr:hypothetical protein [Candidatus Angelobacter sp.]
MQAQLVACEGELPFFRPAKLWLGMFQFGISLVRNTKEKKTGTEKPGRNSNPLDTPGTKNGDCRNNLLQRSRQARGVDDLNQYVILAGVLLLLAGIAYAGYTDLFSRMRKRREERRQRSASRRQSGLS